MEVFTHFFIEDTENVINAVSEESLIYKSFLFISLHVKLNYSKIIG